jgi:hypothetical protein
VRGVEPSLGLRRFFWGMSQLKAIFSDAKCQPRRRNLRPRRNSLTLYRIVTYAFRKAYPMNASVEG